MSKHKLYQKCHPFKKIQAKNFRFSYSIYFSVLLSPFSYCKNRRVESYKKNVDTYFCASLSLLHSLMPFCTFLRVCFRKNKEREKKKKSKVKFFGDRSFGRAQIFELLTTDASHFTRFSWSTRSIESEREKNAKKMVILMSETVMTQSHLNDLFQILKNTHTNMK